MDFDEWAGRWAGWWGKWLPTLLAAYFLAWHGLAWLVVLARLPLAPLPEWVVQWGRWFVVWMIGGMLL